MNQEKLIDTAQAILQKAKLSKLNCESWEAGFIALGLAYQDMDGAEATFRQIFAGQLSNGMLPLSIADESSVGLSTLPVHGFLLKRIYDIATDKPRAKAFAQELFPKVLESHRFFYENRDADENGLIYICHPSESGMATSPTWDSVLGQASTSPFKIVDPLFNALLCWSNEALLALRGILDVEAEGLVDWHELTRFSLENELWNEEYACFNAYDVVAEQSIPCCTSSAILPLMSNALGDTTAHKMLAHLQAPTFGGTEAELTWLCTSYDMEAEDFAPSERWRGGIDLPLNWLLFHGLKRYDVDALDSFGPRVMAFKQLAERVKADSVALVESYGFHDYFDARKSVNVNGLGAEQSAVTAALLIDFLKGHTDSNDPQ